MPPEQPAHPVAISRTRILRRWGTPWWLLTLPALAWVGIFFVYPVFTIIKLSFTSFLPTEAHHGVFGNYKWFFQNTVNVTILERTLITALVVTAVCLLFAYPYAYLMTLVRRPWRNLLLGAVLLSFWTSLMVRNYAWIILLQDNGVVNRALNAVGLPTIHVIGTSRGAAIGMCQILLPFMILPLFATLQAVDRRLLLAAQSLGARPIVAFARVYLPLSLPGVAAGCLLVFTLTLGFFITPAILGSPQNALFSQLIVIQVENLLAWGRGGAMAVILLAATLLTLGLAALLSRRSRGLAGVVE